MQKLKRLLFLLILAELFSQDFDDSFVRGLGQARDRRRVLAYCKLHNLSKREVRLFSRLFKQRNGIC